MEPPPSRDSSPPPPGSPGVTTNSRVTGNTPETSHPSDSGHHKVPNTSSGTTAPNKPQTNSLHNGESFAFTTSDISNSNNVSTGPVLVTNHPTFESIDPWTDNEKSSDKKILSQKPGNPHNSTKALTETKPATKLTMAQILAKTGPSQCLLSDGNMLEPSIPKNSIPLHHEITDKLEDFRSEGKEVDNLLKFKVKPSLIQNMPSKKEIFNSLEAYRQANPDLLKFSVRFLDHSDSADIIHLSTPAPQASVIDGTTTAQRAMNLATKVKTLVNKLNNATFDYSTNLTFNLEHIDFKSTADLFTFNISIPSSLMENHDAIIDQLFPTEHFERILLKSPDRWDIIQLPLTSCYNVQMLARPFKGTETRIPNLYPYKASKGPQLTKLTHAQRLLNVHVVSRKDIMFANAAPDSNIMIPSSTRKDSWRF
ncbi:unnamed protein product [Ambrosiozyma monospora]|uniref:Unnamed protein product n=1 Tax=Ambrosiozyma monospora TaxID=43982 RepID=A0A9W6YW73_AMBMO|nr:unnamed protein product [Ambrosiozyma monospora]